MALNLLNDFIQTYDLAIKSMKASSHFSEEQKAQLFKRMLGPYFAFLKEMSEQLLSPDAFSDIPNQLDAIEKILQNLSPDLEQLHLPQSLEDVFTLTHQDTLVITGWLANQMLSEEEISRAVPEKLKEVLFALERRVGRGPVGAPQRVKVEVSTTRITLQYNVPLANHSGALKIIYNKKTDTIEIEAQFLGNNLGRWDCVNDNIELLSRMRIFLLSKPIEQNEKEIRFVWEASEKNSGAILAFYQLLAQNTFSGIDYHLSLKRFIESQVRTQVGSNLVFELLSLLSIMKKVVSFEFWEILFSAIERENAYQQAIHMAKELILTNSVHNGIKLFTHLIDKGQGYQEAIEAATQWSLNPPPFYLPDRDVMYLFRLLMEKGQGYQEALEAAKQMTRRDSFSVETRLLLKKFVEKEIGYQEAIEAANRMILTDEHRNEGVQLFEKLLERGQGNQEAKEAAKKLIDKEEYSKGHSLFEKLVEKGQGYQEAIEAAKKLIEKEEYSKGHSLLLKLVEKGQGYQEAIEAAKKLIEKEEYFEGHYLFEKLVEKGQGYQEAIEAAKKLIEKEEYWGGIFLFEGLFEKGQGYQEATEVAKKLIEKEEYWGGSSLFEKLVEKGQGYQEAIKVAKDLIENEEFWKGSSLFEKLVEKGQGYQEAMEAAKELFAKEKSLYLFISLVKKGQGYQEAIKVAKDLIDKGEYSKGYVLFMSLVEKGQGYQEALEAVKKLRDTENHWEDGFHLYLKLCDKDRSYVEAVEW